MNNMESVFRKKRQKAQAKAQAKPWPRAPRRVERGYSSWPMKQKQKQKVMDWLKRVDTIFLYLMFAFSLLETRRRIRIVTIFILVITIQVAWRIMESTASIITILIVTGLTTWYLKIFRGIAIQIVDSLGGLICLIICAVLWISARWVVATLNILSRRSMFLITMGLIICYVVNIRWQIITLLTMTIPGPDLARKAIIKMRDEWRKREEAKRKQRARRKLFSLSDDHIPDFTTPFSKKVGRLSPQALTLSELCAYCRQIPVGDLIQRSVTNYRTTFSQPTEPTEFCELCALIAPLVTETAGDDGFGELSIHRGKVWCKKADSSQCQSLSIFTDPGSTAARMGVPIKFLTLPDPRSELQFLLLQKWLDDCNKNHPDHSRDFSKEHELPTRVLDVGSSRDPEKLRLYVAGGKRGRYIALSHCWGGANTFPTTRANLEARLDRIEFSQLPKSFQDAVYVTRNLGIRFLWIDSLCIVQKADEHDNDDDWNHESKLMETVFANAYCTIAATSAANSHEGFLDRHPSGHRPVKLQGIGKAGPFSVYIGRNTDNFDHDVEEGILSQRGWAFQERALSPRTLHFTATQIYWECGSVIRCESLGEIFKLSNWLGDSQFPQGALRLDKTLKQTLFSNIFARYSSLALTVPSDRPIAISGLQDRMASFYQTKFTYGIAQSFLGESLLWKRLGREPMKPICFPSSSPDVPSWSWMAYTGRICYGNPPKNHTWCQNIRIYQSTPNDLPGPPSYRLEAPLFAFDANCSTAPDQLSTTHEIRDESESFVGLIRYDQEGSHDLGDLACVIVARSWARHGCGRGWEDDWGDDRQDGEDSSGGGALGIRYDRESMSKKGSEAYKYKDELYSDEDEWYGDEGYDDEPDLVLEHVLLVARRGDGETYRRVGVAVIYSEYLTEFPEETYFVV